MIVFALLLAGAAIAYGIASWLRIPAPPLLVGVGVLLKLSGVVPDTEMVNFMLLMGVMVLVFVAGAELNPSRFTRQGMAAAKVGLSQFVALGLVGFGLSVWYGYEPIASGYVALAMAASSTFIVVRILKEKRQFYEPFGRLVLGVLLLQDVLVVLALAALMRWEDGQLAVESAVFRSMLLLMAAWIAARTLVPWLLTKLKLDEEAQLIVVLSILFIFVGTAHRLDVPLVTGAFCAGFAVSAFPVNAVIRGQLTSLSDFFIALFFTSLGVLLDLPSLENILFAGALILSVLTVTPLLVTWLAERAGMTARSSIESGLLLAQTSEFSLVVVLLGASQNHLDTELLGAVALVTVVTMVLTQFIATDPNVWRLLRWHPSHFRKELDEQDVADHFVILGAGHNAESLVIELLNRGQEVVVVDHDPVVCDWAERAGARAVRADASDPRVIQKIRAHHARAVISTLRRQADNCRIVKELGDVPILVRTYEASEVDAIEKAGGIPIAYSDAAAQAFLAWFDARDAKEGVVEHPDSAATH